jgi:hypothetical protein
MYRDLDRVQDKCKVVVDREEFVLKVCVVL